VVSMYSDLCGIHTTYVDGSATVIVAGEIDGHTAVPLGAALAELEPGTECAIDLGDVDFIDSSGLRVLILHAVRLRETGGSLTVCAASGPVQRVARIAGVGDLVGNLH
jgi:anti-anti-sigma factor